MSISRIVNNIASVNANRNLDVTGRAVQRSIERLSSGLRINRAGDDAAGLVIANRLRTQVQGLTQAVDNASSGINLINVAEGALDETTTRLNRIRQLSIQAANTAVNDFKARSALQDEAFQSIDEITRISNTTQFSSNFLLNGDFSITTTTIGGQEDIGLNIDASPVASTLLSGKSFLNIIKTRDATAQIIAGDAVGGLQVINTGIINQTDIAVSTGVFTTTQRIQGGTAAESGTTTALIGSFFNGVSISSGLNTGVFVFSGVLSDGITQYNGTFSIALTGGQNTVKGVVSSIRVAIDTAEQALFGVSSASSVPTAFRTQVTLGSGTNAGRIILFTEGNLINQANLNITLFREAGTVLTQANGVTRSGALGIDSGIAGQGQVGNSVDAITGTTFGVGQFDIQVTDVQSAQQRKVQNTISIEDS